MSAALWCHVCKTEKPGDAFSKPEGGSGLPLACTACQAEGWTYRARKVKAKPVKAKPAEPGEQQQRESAPEALPQLVTVYRRHGVPRRYRTKDGLIGRRVPEPGW